MTYRFLSWIANIIPTNRKVVVLRDAYWDAEIGRQRKEFNAIKKRADPFLLAGRNAHESLLNERKPLPDWTPIAIARRAAKERRNSAQAEQYIATHAALHGAVKAHAGE